MAAAAKIKIENYVCSANLGMKFDLSAIAAKNPQFIEEIPKKNCVMMKITTPKAAAMLFASGKLVCTGVNTEDGIKLAARKFTHVIQQMDYPGVALIDFKVQTIIGTCICPFRILLEQFALEHRTECTYEPELYPALLFRREQPSVTILIFTSGKIVLKGKRVADLDTIFAQLYPVLQKFQDNKS